MRCFELGENCIHFASKLLEDTLRGWGLSSAQDAGYGARLLEAPSPLVLVAVFIPSWLRRQRRQAWVAMRAILTRLVPPVPLVRRVAPAGLARLVTPALTWVRIFPASRVPSSSSAVAPVSTVRASADSSFSHGAEFLAFIGVMGVEVVVHTVPVAPGGFGQILAPLGVRLCREHGSPLALHVLGLGLLLFWVCGRQLEEGEASLLSSGALGRQVEQLWGGAEVFVHRQLLLHLDVAHAIREGRNDGFLGHPGDLEARAVEALDVLLQGLSRFLLDVAHVAHGGRPVAGTLEVGNEAGTHLVPGGDRAWGQVQEPSASTFLQRHGEPVRHDLFVPAGCFDSQLVELEELRGISCAVIARRQVRLELAGPRDATQLGGVGAAACGGRGGFWLRVSLALWVHLRRSWEQCRILTCRSWSRVLASRGRER